MFADCRGSGLAEPGCSSSASGIPHQNAPSECTGQWSSSHGPDGPFERTSQDELSGCSSSDAQPNGQGCAPATWVHLFCVLAAHLVARVQERRCGSSVRPCRAPAPRQMRRRPRPLTAAVDGQPPPFSRQWVGAVRTTVTQSPWQLSTAFPQRTVERPHANEGERPPLRTRLLVGATSVPANHTRVAAQGATASPPTRTTIP